MGNITFNIKEKITPAVRGTLFPPQKTKSPFSGGHQKSLVSKGVFPFLKVLGKQCRNSVFFFTYREGAQSVGAQ